MAAKRADLSEALKSWKPVGISLSVFDIGLTEQMPTKIQFDLSGVQRGWAACRDFERDGAQHKHKRSVVDLII